VFLTLVGTGVFGIPVEWVVGALRRALYLFRHCNLEVFVVVFTSEMVPPELNALIQEVNEVWPTAAASAPPAAAAKVAGSQGQGGIFEGGQQKQQSKQ
jgi:hypothetical protein